MTAVLPPRTRPAPAPVAPPPPLAPPRPVAPVAGRAVRRLATAGLCVGAGYLLLGQLSGAVDSWALLSGVDGAWLLVALLLEVASLAAYAALTRAVLPRNERPAFLRILGIDLSTMAVSHVVPAGSAVGLGLGYRLLTAEGVRGPSAVFAKTFQAVGSAVVLNVLLWIALITSVPLHGLNSLYGLVALLGAGLLTTVGVLAVLLLRGRDRIAAGLARGLGRLPRVSEEAVHVGVLAAVENLRRFTADRRLLRSAAVLAAANWLLDAAALWACVRAFGHTLGPIGAFVPYGIAAVAAALPATPGGLGIVEASLIPSLVAFSTPHAVAVLGVLAWRAVTYLLPIPVGAVSYVLLQRTRSSRTPSAVAGAPAHTAAGRWQGDPGHLASTT